MTSFTKTTRTIGLVTLASLSLAACENNPKGSAGALLGAAAGGLIGAAAGGGAEGIAAGVLLGGLAGGAVGSALDAQDRRLAMAETQRVLELEKTGSTGTWQNPDTGHRGTITPTRTYQRTGGQYCREYQQTITVGGRTEQAYGTACRQPDGDWKVVS